MKDSISSAGNSYNPYSAQNYHRSPKPLNSQGSASGLSGGKDSLQVSQEKLEQQVAARFHANNFQLPNERLAVVARAGKYVFYAVALPPYILLYGIPKWILFVAMPEIMLVIQQQLMKGCRALKERLMLVVQPCINACKTLFNQLKRTLGLESKNNFLMSFTQAPWRMLQTLYGKTLKAMQKALTTLKHKIGEYSSAVQEKINVFFKRTGQTAKRLALAPFKAIQKRLELALSGATTLLKALKNLPKAMYKRAENFNAAVLNPIKHAIKKLRDFSQTVAKRLKSVQEGIKERVAHGMLPLLAPFAPKLFNKLLNKWIKDNPALNQAIEKKADKWNQRLAPLMTAGRMLRKGLLHLSQPQVAARKLFSKLQMRGEEAKKYLSEQIALPIKETFQKQFNKAKKAIERAQKFASKCAAKAKEIPQQLALLLPTPLVNLFGIQLNPNLIPWAIVKKQKKLRQKIAKKLSFVSKGIKKAKTWAVSGVNKMQDRAYAFCKALWKLANRFKSVKQKTGEVAVEVKMAYRRRKHWVRLMMAWIKVLSRHWIAKMKEFASQLGRETRKKMHLEGLDRRA